MRDRARKTQDERRAATGYCQCPELGNGVYAALRARGWPDRYAWVASSLAAVPGRLNWQGSSRIAEICGCSKRTVQRVLYLLRRKGLIRDLLLYTGDRLDGMRAAVWHPQVVRDVSVLQSLAPKLTPSQPEASERRPRPVGVGRKKAHHRPEAAYPAWTVPPAPPPEELQHVKQALLEYVRRSVHVHPVREHVVELHLEQEQGKPQPGGVHADPPSTPAPELAEPERVTPERRRPGDDDPHERGPP